MATYNELPDLIEPSDVFGAEPSTDAGYARETFALTLVSGDVVNTGRILVLDHVEKTAPSKSIQWFSLATIAAQSGLWYQSGACVAGTKSAFTRSE